MWVNISENSERMSFMLSVNALLVVIKTSVYCNQWWGVGTSGLKGCEMLYHSPRYLATSILREEGHRCSIMDRYGRGGKDYISTNLMIFLL
jgi:hypothetical protein